MSAADAITYHNAHRGLAITILHNGSTLATDGNVNTVYDCQSGSKSFIGALALKIAQELGTTIDARVSVQIPAWASYSLTTGFIGKRIATVRTLLSMQSGLQGGNIGSVETYEQAAAVNIYNACIGFFRYGPRAFQAYGLYGKNALTSLAYSGDLAAYLAEKVLPVGMTIDHWDYATTGEPLLAHGANLSSNEWVKWGEYLRTTIPGDANLASLIAPSPYAPYGTTFWLTQGDWLQAVRGQGDDSNPIPGNGYAAWGAFNQRLYVLPDFGLVVARFGTEDLSIIEDASSWNEEDFLDALLA